MKLTVEAVDIEDLKFQLSKICADLCLLSTSMGLEEATVAPVKETKKRVKKTQPEAQPVAQAEEELETKPTPPVSPDLKEEVFRSLKALSTNKGMIVAKNLLQQFGCARISELKEEQYDEFIKACNTAAA